MVSDVAQHNRRDAKFGHLGKGCASQVMCGPTLCNNLVSPHDIRDYVLANTKFTSGID